MLFDMSFIGYKTLLEKEKMLVSCIFFPFPTVSSTRSKMDVTILAKLQIFFCTMIPTLIKDRNYHFSEGPLHGSVVECWTCNSGVLGSTCTGSSRVFCASGLRQDTSEPQPITGETQERHG